MHRAGLGDETMCAVAVPSHSPRRVYPVAISEPSAAIGLATSTVVFDAGEVRDARPRRAGFQLLLQRGSTPSTVNGSLSCNHTAPPP